MNFSKSLGDERQSSDVCFLGKLFGVTALEQLACDDVLRAVFDTQLEASLNLVSGTGEIAVTRATHLPVGGEMFNARLGGVKESSEPIKLLLHGKGTRFSFACSCV
jgi:hypothetical protein